MWKSLDKRVAGFLLKESLLEGTKMLKITRGTVEVTDAKRLGDLLGDE